MRARPAAAHRSQEWGPDNDGGETRTAAGQRTGEREEDARGNNGFRKKKELQHHIKNTFCI